METKIEVINENYNSKLKAKDYYEKQIRNILLIRRNYEFILRFLHDIIQSGRFKGSKVLEVGSGATVHNIASASAHFSSIVQSDYVLDNVQELRRWHEGTSSLDWSQFLDMVLELEREHDNKKNYRHHLESRIRKSVKCVVRGDLRSNNVLPLEQMTNPDTLPPYDLIISIQAIETVALDFDDYVSILKRLNSLLKRGGGLIVCGFEKGGYWKVGGTFFHHVQLTFGQVCDAFGQAGFRTVELKSLPKVQTEYDVEYESLFGVAAEKL